MRAAPEAAAWKNFYRIIFLLFLMWVYKNLEVYRRALGLCEVVDKLTLSFPEHEKYELGRQMRRAASSICMNISEGSLRRTSKDFISFLHNSLGSAGEVETQVEIVFGKWYFDFDSKRKLLKEVDEIKKMIYGLMKWVEKKNVK